MGADVMHGFWQWKLWFPNKIFTLNATTITLIAISMKLPVDLSISSYEDFDDNTEFTKVTSMIFLVTMLANFLPSLGLMDDRELLTNIVALGILMITIIVDIFIQFFTEVSYWGFYEIPFLIFLILWPFSVALTVSTFRKILEQRYKESLQLVLSHQEKNFSYKDLGRYVKKFWMMTETRNPQFIIACSPVSCAFGVLCAFLTFSSVLRIIEMKGFWYGSTPVYTWSLKIIFFLQSIGSVVGSIAPVFRCFTSIGHYSLYKNWSKNNLNFFRVEKYWIQRLHQWKRSHVRSHIPGRHCKIVFHYTKNTFLNVCITFQILVLVICKTICLVPRTFLILLSYCWCFIKSFMKKFNTVADESVEIEEYIQSMLHKFKKRRSFQEEC